jgi:hypothetical protein
MPFHNTLNLGCVWCAPESVLPRLRHAVPHSGHRAAYRLKDLVGSTLLRSNGSGK